MGDWPPDRTLVIEVPDKPTGGTPDSRIYLWTVPARLAGAWRGTLISPQGTETAELQIVQWYQNISATISLPRSHMSGEGRLNGAAGTLMVQVPGALGSEPLALTLRASGDQIEAEGSAGRAGYLLRATRVRH